MYDVTFGGYRFPQNPSEITVENTRHAVVQTLPENGQRVQAVLPALREAELVGELFSATAQETMAQYEALRMAYEQRGAALLSLPGCPPFYAYFVRLRLQAVGDGRTLRYRADFLEEGSQP